MMKDIRLLLANKLLKVSAIKLQPDRPFVWLRGWNSPIYADNRMALSYPQLRNFIKTELSRIIVEFYPDAEVIAGVTIGAIAPAAIVADALGLPLIYVRDKAKDHGLENQIEGNIKPGQKVVLFEDVISTGANCIAAAQTVMIAGGQVLGVAALFSYEFAMAREALEAEQLPVHTLTDYNAMIEAAVESGELTRTDVEMLQQWHDDPENWTPLPEPND